MVERVISLATLAVIYSWNSWGIECSVLEIKKILAFAMVNGCVLVPSTNIIKTDAATHAIPAWKMSIQGKTGRKS